MNQAVTSVATLGGAARIGVSGTASFMAIDDFKKLLKANEHRFSDIFQLQGESWQIAARDLVCSGLSGSVPDKRLVVKAQLVMNHLRQLANSANAAKHYLKAHGGILALGRLTTVGIIEATGQGHLCNEDGVPFSEALKTAQFRLRALTEGEMGGKGVIAKRGPIVGRFDNIQVYRP